MTLIKGSVRVKDSDSDAQLIQGAFVCDECSLMSIGFIVTRRSRYAEEPADRLDGAGGNVRWLPPKGPGREFEDVPSHIAQAASEAYEVESIGAHRAAALMARSVVEATAKEKGIASGTLFAKIDAMRADDLIREHVKEAAHEIRHLGNDMAHGDFIDPVTEEEAVEVLDLMAEILHEVFQSPAKIEARKAARLAKKASGNDGGD
jgi:hypothetical protein